MKNIFRVLVLLSASALLSNTAYAVEKGNARASCKDDAHKFCSDVKPGGGRILDCLAEHSKELSDGCRTAVENREKHKQEHGGKADTASPKDSSGTK